MTHTAYAHRMKLAQVIAAFLFAVLLAGAPAAVAQRGGRGGGAVRGGFSGGHAAASFAGRGAAISRGFVARPTYAAVRPAYAARPAYSVAPRISSGRPSFYRRPGYGRPGFRIVGGSAYGIGYGLGYPYGYGLYDSGVGFSSGDDYNPNELAEVPGPYADPNAGAYADPSPGPTVAENYPPVPAPAYRSAQPTPAPEDAVTLIFKDGRPPLEIHNYALTRTTLYVTDAKHRDIPVADLDLAATQKVNEDAGVHFQLPTPN